MPQKKPPRILFNPDHMEVARDLLSNEEAGRLFFAVCDYAMKGKLPENESKSFLACFKLMSGEIDENVRRYADRCERNRQNIKRRWEQRETHSPDVYDGIPSNTTVYDGIPSNTTCTNIKKDKIDKSKVEEVYLTAADDDLSAQIAAYQRADDLIRRYKLPDSDMSREALLEDAEKVGFDRLEEALKQASLSNSKSSISVNFYRAVLNSRGKQTEGHAYAGYRQL